MKLLAVVTLALSMFAVQVQAHEEAPQSTMSPEQEYAARVCQHRAANAAWGAFAAFQGAPLTFKYLPYEQMKKMYDEDAIPHDAVYAVDVEDLGDKKDFEVAVASGYHQAKKWMEEGRTNPGLSILFAVFQQYCLPKTEVHNDHN